MIPVDPETIAAFKQLGPHSLTVAVTVWLIFELRVRSLMLRTFAGHRAVTRKLGVTDADVEAELRALKSGTGEVTGA